MPTNHKIGFVYLRFLLADLFGLSPVGDLLEGVVKFLSHRCLAGALLLHIFGWLQGPRALIQEVTAVQVGLLRGATVDGLDWHGLCHLDCFD